MAPTRLGRQGLVFEVGSACGGAPGELRDAGADSGSRRREAPQSGARWPQSRETVGPYQGGARHGLGGALRGAGICLRHCSEGFSRFLQSGFRPGRCRHLRKLKEETPASRSMGRRCGEWGPGGWYRRGSAGSSCLTAAGGTPALGLLISPDDPREDLSGRTMLRAVQREREAGEGRGRAGLASVVQPLALTPV